MEGEILIYPASVIFLWCWAYIKTIKVSGLEARMNYFIVLIVVIGASVISFFVIVTPNEDCKGFLCELDYFLPWLGLVVLLVTVPPIVMIVLAFKREKQLEKKQNEKDPLV